MNELKKIVAKNINTLRISSHLTQFELGEKLNYSDKAISRWERGEAIPDAYVLQKMSEIFGTTVDYLLTDHTNDTVDEAEAVTDTDSELSADTEQDAEPVSEIETEPQGKIKPKIAINHGVITSISFIGTWTLSLFIFVVFFLFNKIIWQIFPITLPVSLIVLLVLNSIWGKGKNNLFIISAIVWSIIICLYLVFIKFNWWALFLLGIPAQILVCLCFNIIRKK